MILVRKSRRETSRSTWRRDRNDVLPEARLLSDVEGAHWAGKTHRCARRAASPSLHLCPRFWLLLALWRRPYDDGFSCFTRLPVLSGCLQRLVRASQGRRGATPVAAVPRHRSFTAPSLPNHLHSLLYAPTRNERRPKKSQKINDQQKREERAWTRIRGD